jgi:hypothetical protein
MRGRGVRRLRDGDMWRKESGLDDMLWIERYVGGSMRMKCHKVLMEVKT